MISRPRNHLKGDRVKDDYLVEIMHALIRKVTPRSDILIINNFNTAKNDITAQKSIQSHQSKSLSFGRDNARTHQNSDTSK